MSDMIVPANFHCNTKVKSSASPGFRVNRDYFGNHQSASTAVWFADTFVHPSCKATRHGPFHSALFRFKFLQLGNHENCILHLGSIFSTHAIGCIGHWTIVKCWISDCLLFYHSCICSTPPQISCTNFLLPFCEPVSTDGECFRKLNDRGYLYVKLYFHDMKPVHKFVIFCVVLWMKYVVLVWNTERWYLLKFSIPILDPTGRQEKVSVQQNVCPSCCRLRSIRTRFERV